MKRSHDAVGLFFIFRPCEPLARVNADCPAGRSRRSEAQARPALGGADAASGSGLLGLKDRAEAIGGTISLYSHAVHGHRHASSSESPTRRKQILISAPS